MLDIGNKVRYLDPNSKEIKTGVVYSVKTKEITDGGQSIVIDRTYLIDTGDDNPEVPAMQEFKDGELIGEMRQPATIEVRIKQ